MWDTFMDEDGLVLKLRFSADGAARDEVETVAVGVAELAAAEAATETEESKPEEAATEESKPEGVGVGPTRMARGDGGVEARGDGGVEARADGVDPPTRMARYSECEGSPRRTRGHVLVHQQELRRGVC